MMCNVDWRFDSFATPTMNNTEIKTKIEEIIDSNMEEIPYEGTEVDKETMINELMNFFRELTKQKIILELVLKLNVDIRDSLEK